MSALSAISQQDWLAFAQTAVVAAVLLALALLAGRTGRFERPVTRKTLHIGMGATYVLHWPLYSNAPYARWLCAAVPCAASAAFLLVGLGAVPLKALVDSATRSGRREELLTGPLLYGVVHMLLTVVFWTHSPAGVVAVAVLCFGDGAAELAGRRARAKLWHNSSKSWAGSIACLVASMAGALPYALFFRAAGGWPQPVGVGRLAAGCALCSAVGCVVESLPLDGDNLWVPLAAAVTAVWFFGF